MKHKAQFIVDLILIVALITIAVIFVAMTVKVNRAEKRDKIEQSIIEELKLQATDYGDGDYYDDEEEDAPDSEELVRVTAERDTYKKLYESLVNKLVGVVKKGGDKE